MKPKMFYFGPWDEPGHHMCAESLPRNLEEQRTLSDFTRSNPWGYEIDGRLLPRDRTAGSAAVHQKDGWTALSFWDYTIDSRPGSHSTYLAEGSFDFEQMVEMAKTRFAYRWNKMKFEVKLAGVAV